MNVGKALFFIGLGILILGAVLWWGPRLPLLNRLGRLPGDIRIEGENYRFYFPWVTSLILSAILTALVYFWGKGR